VTDWTTVERAAQRGGRLSFDGPRIFAVVTDEERAEMLAGVSPVLLLVVKMLSWRHARFDRLVFG
jgi:hypothetical protein